MKPSNTLAIRKPYDPSARSRLSFKTETRTKQSFKAECDINNIMAKYAKTGILEHARNVQGAYGDFSDVPDFQEARNRLIAAEQAFMALPAKIRKEFDNEPANLVAFIDNDDNYDEAVKLGLIPPKPKPEPKSADGSHGNTKPPSKPAKGGEDKLGESEGGTPSP